MKKFLEQKMTEQKMLVYDIFEDRLKTPEAENVFLEFEGRQWTYREFHAALQPVARWLMNDLGIEKGEMVGLDGTNSPEFIMLWLALEAIGAKPAFINCNLTGQALSHCVKLANARYLLADEDVRHLITTIETDLESAGSKVVYYSQATIAGLSPVDLATATPLPRERRMVADPFEPANLIYTSGTTGLPKGTIITRAKETGLQLAHTIVGIKAGDKMYTCLPLYHGAAHGLCLLPCIGVAATVVLSRKFSHAVFWPEVRQSGATHIQYVGELCRYLVNAPPSPLDKQHKVRVAWGNGMRPDVWERFRERFGIETIHELYAATDGMLSVTNANRGPFGRNAIAVRGGLWWLLNSGFEKRIRIDPDTQEVARDAAGRVIEVGVDEPGESIMWMDPGKPDEGTPTYFNNHGAAVKRRVRNAFKEGDVWFRTGDLMRQDEDGRLFFVDRLGDTFRWRSENVSTNEVSDVVGLFPDVVETNVYGVLVPNADGRAGCAAVVPVEGKGEEKINWQELARHCLDRLPRYAVPVFVRVVRQLEYTGTMKLQKGRLRSEGVELDAIEKGAKDKGEAAVDSMYWLPPGGQEYVPFRRKDLDELKGGRVRL